MRLEEIQVALEAAADISNHHEFVIAGSLSVLGYVDPPPEMMSMSIDIDFYPLRDPGRALEISTALGEDSDFHERNGYYLDPIHPELPVLPQGWRERLVEVRLGKVTAYFLNVNDTAISKYARSADHDFRWLEAGYDAGILRIDMIEASARFTVDYPEEKDKKKIIAGIALHRAAMKPDGKLAKELLAFLHHAKPEEIVSADIDDTIYSGKIIWTGEQRAVQRMDNGTLVIHATEAWTTMPELSQYHHIRYTDGEMTLE
ncbi:DUF6036 family nucleotidyltransferase [Actimicrobium sp. CCI2.3]|uniref:DUF6036 family nucleotidyltransferase n=1 Tax=Actimicrobium sp. CCI2.3 TaxID=3048616 RepID=UPI002AB57C53|nr:DUF6036 family nucleotidyltransferase [Actimicrobium sp. CCI2.3]MDY7573891.1 DUF6036 family nucleotidyltransferase [Actimicrobium sp. CCI2.3]MEB0023387.1 hypothetical protein [Actimicrobium sp. CCI2.3]